MKPETQKVTEIIKVETKQLFADYLVMRAEWSAKQFENLLALTESDVIKQGGYDYKEYCQKATKFRTSEKMYTDEEINKMFPLDQPYYRHTKASIAFWNKVCNIKTKGAAAFIEKDRTDSIAQYENATVKLAFRIIKKGINIEKMTASSIGFKEGNIETLFSDGTNWVKAQTILAWGEINAPHYRYLVK